MELDWKMVMPPTIYDRSVLSLDDKSNLTARIENFGPVTLVAAYYTTFVDDGPVPDHFECMAIIDDPVEARTWIEEIIFPKLTEVHAAAMSSSAEPLPDPVVRWQLDSGVWKDSDGFEITFRFRELGLVGGRGGYQVFSYDQKDEFSCGTLVNSRDEIDEWAMRYIKKMRP